MLEIVSKIEKSVTGSEMPNKNTALLSIFAFADLLIRVVLPLLLLFSPFARFHIYAWILIGQFLLGDIISVKFGKKYSVMILIAALELCVFADIIRSCFLYMTQ